MAIFLCSFLHVTRTILYSHFGQYNRSAYFYKYVSDLKPSDVALQVLFHILARWVAIFQYRAIVDKSFHSLLEWQVSLKRFWTC
jgi:hypothetical protein